MQIVLENFLSTYPLMLLSTSPREALFAWNLSSFIVESNLLFPCSLSDPPLSFAKVRLSLTFTFSHPAIWWSGKTDLFLFLLARAALASSSCIIRLQWVSGHSFLPGNDAADELFRRGAQLVPSAIPCSLFSSYLLYLLFCFLRLAAYCLI